VNWDALGAGAEMMGAIGVIVSLLYLSRQIRQSSDQTKQNSEIARGTAYQQFRNQVNDVVALRVADPVLNSIWERGLQDYDSLDVDEVARFNSMVFMIVGNWESQFYLQESGVLDPEMGAGRKLVTDTPGFQRWWERRGDTYNSRFRAHIESYLRGSA
jgi:hypothetical protein